MITARVDAYLSALTKLGTSYEELRRMPADSVSARGDALRARLAERLGLPTARLDEIKLDLSQAVGTDTNVTSSPEVSEEKLEYLFGIPATEVDLDTTNALPDPVRAIALPQISVWRRDYLAELWDTQDRVVHGTFQAPIVEPDLIGIGEVRPVALGDTGENPALTRLLARRAHVDTRLSDLEAQNPTPSTATTTTFDAVLAETEGIGLDIVGPWTNKLASVAQAKDDGEEYAALLLPHCLTTSEFSYLYGIRDGLAQSPATEEEWDVVYASSFRRRSERCTPRGVTKRRPTRLRLRPSSSRHCRW